MPALNDILTEIQQWKPFEGSDNDLPMLARFINEADPHLVDPQQVDAFLKINNIRFAINRIIIDNAFDNLVSQIPSRFTFNILKLPNLNPTFFTATDLIRLLKAFPDRHERLSHFFESIDPDIIQQLENIRWTPYTLAQVFDLIAGKSPASFTRTSSNSWGSPLGHIDELRCFANVDQATKEIATTVYVQSVMSHESIAKSAYNLDSEVTPVLRTIDDKTACLYTLMTEENDKSLTPFKKLLKLLEETVNELQPEGLFEIANLDKDLEAMIKSIHWSAFKLAHVYRILSRHQTDFMSSPFQSFTMYHLELFSITDEVSARAGELLYATKKISETDPQCDLKPLAREICATDEQGIIFTHGDDFDDIYDLALTLDEMWQEDWDGLLNLPGVRNVLTLSPNSCSLEDIEDLLDCFTEKERAQMHNREYFLLLPNMMTNILNSLSLVDRWELLATNTDIQTVFVTYVASAQGEKLFSYFNEMTQDKKTQSIVLNLLEQGYEKLDEREGLSEAQWKKFHFFAPVKEPRPFLDKLQVALDVAVGVPSRNDAAHARV